MSSTSTGTTSFPPIVAVIIIWLAAALAVGAAGLLARAPVPPPAIAFGLTLLILLLVWRMPSLREQVWAKGPGPLVAFHLIRIAAGIYFLSLSGRGVLPPEFGLVAGWGDIAVGIGALLVLWRCIPVRTASRRRALLLWNAFGLLDILTVLANGIRLFVGDPGVAAPFTSLPLALLPTFVVPIVLVTHVLLFTGWRRVLEASNADRS